MADGEPIFCNGEQERVVVVSGTTGEHTTGNGVSGEER